MSSGSVDNIAVAPSVEYYMDLYSQLKGGRRKQFDQWLAGMERYCRGTTSGSTQSVMSWFLETNPMGARESLHRIFVDGAKFKNW